MPPRLLPVFLVVAVIIVDPAVQIARASGSLQELMERSPFGGAEAGPAANPAAEQPLQFRGVIEERGKRIFSIYQISSRRSMWMDLKRQTEGIRIESYDETQEWISVLYLGKSYRLPLSGGTRKITIAHTAPPKAPEPEETNEYHDKPFRIGHVFEENMIRQAVREPTATPPEPSATTNNP
jgi:hypothetical protein